MTYFQTKTKQQLMAAALLAGAAALTENAFTGIGEAWAQLRSALSWDAQVQSRSESLAHRGPHLSTVSA